MLPRTVFYWLTSFGCAAAGYGLLWALLPGHYVFGAPYRMFLYHEAHPLAYIALCCGCFGPLAAVATNIFRRRGRWGRWGVVGMLALATVVLSSPLGGLLWHWHDMQAGYFPHDWGWKLLAGAWEGLTTGCCLCPTTCWACSFAMGCWRWELSGFRPLAARASRVEVLQQEISVSTQYAKLGSILIFRLMLRGNLVEHPVCRGLAKA